VKFTPSLDDNVDSTEGGRLAYELTDGKVVLHGHGLDPDVSPSLPNRMRLALEALTHKFISDKIITHSLEIKEEKVVSRGSILSKSFGLWSSFVT